MDKLKENIFWIGLGGAGIVVAVLAWLLVLSPLYGGGKDSLGLKSKALQNILVKVESFNKKDRVPTTRYLEYLEDRVDSLRKDHNVGVDWYNSRRERFAEFFAGPDEPSASEFAARYETGVESLVNDYRAKFEIVIPEEGDPVPDVNLVDQAEILQDRLSRIMKEFWVMSEIFRVAMDLELGGLRKIRFPERFNAKKERAHEKYDFIELEVTIDLPLSKLEDLVTELFASPRVMFSLSGVDARKSQEQLLPYKKITVEKEFPTDLEAQSASYDIPEAVVGVTLTLGALDLDEIPSIESPSDEGYDDEEYDDEYVEEDDE